MSKEQMQKLIELQKFIATCDDKDLLVTISKSVAGRYKVLTNKEVVKFHPGETVSFNSKTGQGRLQGIVTKVNRVSVTVLVGKVTWKVSPGLLKKEISQAA